MRKNNLYVIFLLVSCLSSVLVAAETDAVQSKQELCLSESKNNNAQLQKILEDWSTGNRRGSPDEYEQHIKQIESSRGALDYELVTELVGLGFLFQEQEKYADAAQVIQRAIFVIRANKGLYSIEQLPLIDLLIRSNIARGEWKQVADNFDMMYWLYRRNYAKDDPRQLLVLKRLRRWYVESYNKDTGRSLDQLFTSAEAVHEQALNIMRACTGDEREAQCFWYKSCCADADESRGICPVDRG